MRYPLRFLQRAGLLSTLLIGGVLGGLLAPLPSDAVGPPTLTLQIDGVPLVTSTGVTVANNGSILGSAVACSSADVGLGYTACYSVLTSTTVAYRANNTRLYRIQNATSTPARLRVGDNLGQDNFSLVGVQFVPVNSATQATATVTNWGTPDANTNESHTLKVTMRHKFDAPVNVNNATGLVVGSTTIGQAAFGMASGGEFRSAPLSTPVPTTTLFCGTTAALARCNTVGDKVVLTGTGIFSGTTAVSILSPGAPTAPNSNPLSLTVGAGNANNSIVGYAGLTNATMGQVNPTYPKFDCKDPNALPANTKCQPDITLTLTATLKGPDTFVMLNGGGDGYCALCNFAQDNTRLTRLFTFLTGVVAFLDWWENNHADNPALRANIEKAQAFLAGFNGPPADPGCAGAKYIQGNILYEGGKSLITISGNGGVDVVPAPPATGTLTIRKNTTGETNDTFNFNINGPSPSTPSITMGSTDTKSIDVTVNAGTYEVTEGTNPENWQFNSANCELDGESQTGEPTTHGVTGVVVQSGGHVTCIFHNNFVTPPPVTAMITIFKALRGCPPTEGTCPHVSFNFAISGPSPLTNTTVSVVTNDDGRGVITVPVIPTNPLDLGSLYTVEETPMTPGWVLEVAYPDPTPPSCYTHPFGELVAEGRTPTFPVASGEISCVFVNKQE